jgi:hypothetical protein
VLTPGRASASAFFLLQPLCVIARDRLQRGADYEACRGLHSPRNSHEPAAQLRLHFTQARSDFTRY